MPGPGYSASLAQTSVLLTTTPTHLMPGFTGHTIRVSSSAGGQLRAVSSSNETTCRYTRDFSPTSITYAGDVSSSGRSTPRGPDINKDLPRIPSTSTGLWDAKPVTVSSEIMASPVIPSTPSLPPLPVLRNLKRTAVTEAQKIAARYRRRYGSLEALRSEVYRPPKLEVSSCLVLDTPPVSPTDTVGSSSILRK